MLFSKQVINKNQGAPLDLYQHPLIIKTFSVHFYLTTPKQKIKNYELPDPPKSGVALAIQAVSSFATNLAYLPCFLGRTCTKDVPR
jgi:hypothetical protein